MRQAARDRADLGCALLTIARSAIGARLGISSEALAANAALAEPAATFVTLRHSGELRGCIGSLEPRRPLHVDVRENALAAAFRDPRFPPLGMGEFEAMSVEVSLLSATEPVAAPDENDLVIRLRPGVDGVVLECEGRRATFLPQVWESIADPREFLAALKQKGGWPDRFWSPRMNASVYSVTKWMESEYAASGQAR